MKKRFEHYLDHQEEKSEKTILNGKAIMIAMTGGHVHSWTKFQKKIYTLNQSSNYLKCYK